jgi:tetratricopeptide (TPR) repeat protein
MKHVVRLSVTLFLILSAGLVAFSAQTSDSFQNLGKHHFKITTESADAQRAFDRGLTLAYGFSYHRAEGEFRRAAEADPNCAMAWWGVALVNGPHINFAAVPPDRAKVAWEAASKAKTLASGATKLEKALIEAMDKRYADPPPSDRASLDQAYAKAMGDVWRAYPRNADVGNLYAEALMDLHPWDLWTKDGKSRPWTPQIVATLERVLALNPKHPGANHLYIHAIEASPRPERATPAADRLRNLVPGLSHLVHMPAHIYARTGRWKDAALSNVAAMKADEAYRAAYPRPGFYAMYMAHNAHFLAFTAMMRGQSEEAIRLARSMVANIPEDFLRDYTVTADGFLIFPSEVLMRFGRWKEILQEPAPRAGFPLSRALWHYTRASALNSLNRPKEADEERVAFRDAAAEIPAEWTFGNSKASDLVAIASHTLDGEFSAKANRYDEAIKSLREAVRIEDTLPYDEPPDWIQPVRHTLGAVLLRADRPKEAEQVYKEDLKKFPGNGWSLFGLAQAMEKQGKRPQTVRLAQARFKKAWSDADAKLEATCFCQAGL